MISILNAEYSLENLMLAGIGFLAGGVLAIVALKLKLLPDLRIKWAIAAAGIVIGAILVLVGLSGGL